MAVNETLTLLAGVTASGAGTAVQVEDVAGRESVPYLVRGITVADVAIQGSFDGTNFVTLKTMSADEAGLVPAFPYMRANVTAYTSGTITAGIRADKVFGT